MSSPSTSSSSASVPLSTSKFLALGGAASELYFLRNLGPALPLTPNSRFILAAKWEQDYRVLFPASESRIEQLGADYILFTNFSINLVSPDDEDKVLQKYRTLQCESYKTWPKIHNFVRFLETSDKQLLENEFYYNCSRAHRIGSDLLQQFGIKFDPKLKYQPLCEIKLFTHDKDSSNPSYCFIPDPSKEQMPKLESEEESNAPIPSGINTSLPLSKLLPKTAPVSVKKEEKKPTELKFQVDESTLFERKKAQKKLAKMALAKQQQSKQTFFKSLSVSNKKSKN
jgi:hypothetical protein